MELLQVLNIETFKKFIQYFTFKYTHKKKYHKKYKFEDFFFYRTKSLESRSPDPLPKTGVPYNSKFWIHHRQN